MKFHQTVGIILLLSIGLTVMQACTSTQHAGMRTIAAGYDSLAATKKIMQIRQLPLSLFDTGTFAPTEFQAIVYRLFRPNTKGQKNTFPLVVLFHGSGQIGADNHSQVGYLPKLFASPGLQQNHPAFVLAPQFATRSADYTYGNDSVAESHARPCLQTAIKLIDSLIAVLPIDSKRIYVVGFSMGGSTAVNALCARPDLFAAGISISGIAPLHCYEVLQHKPLWLMHGSDDTENRIDSDQVLFSQLKKNKKCRFWVYEGTNHNDIFLKLIAPETLPDWLFRQRNQD